MTTPNFIKINSMVETASARADTWADLFHEFAA
jgi:hypothetical protein